MAHGLVTRWGRRSSLNVVARALTLFSVSSLVGLLAAVAAWVTSLVIVGDDEILLASNRSFEWGTVIGVVTAVFVIGVVLSMYRSVEPVLTLLAGVAGCVLLYNVREFPFGDDNSGLSTVNSDYWTVVAAMIAIFALLVISLRITRSNTPR